MKVRKVTLLLALSVLAGGGTAVKAGDVFTHASLDDRSFTEGFLFLSPAASALGCANLCALDPSCLTVTFHPRERACRGHFVYVTSSSAHDESPGARSFSRLLTRENQLRQQCLGEGVQPLVVPALAIDRHVRCQNHWMVILRRQDGSVDFYRNWTECRAGFGNVDGEYWIGLDTLHRMTSTLPYLLTVDLADWQGNTTTVSFSNLTVGPQEDFYRLGQVQFDGGVGNDSLTYHNGARFSTYDVDNDIRKKKSCAEKLHGAWWYVGCTSSNLLGDYKPSGHAPGKDGVSWKTWPLGNTSYSMKMAQMKIRLTP